MSIGRFSRSTKELGSPGMTMKKPSSQEMTVGQAVARSEGRILCENSFNLKTISHGDFGHFRDNNLIILSKVAKIALRDCF